MPSLDHLSQIITQLGHHSALLARMTTAVWDADVMITVDADLQDDPKWQVRPWLLLVKYKKMPYWSIWLETINNVPTISPITKKRRINIGCWSDVFGYDIIFWSKNIGSASLQRKWCQWRSWNNEGDTSQHYERDSKCQTDIKMASIWKGLLQFYMNCTACRSVFSMQL